MSNQIIIDTNVLVVANNRSSPHATTECVIACIRFLRTVRSNGHLVIDDAFEIINEYKRKVNQNGQPGVGDEFLKWVLINWQNTSRCTCTSITQDSTRTYAEFPNDPSLEGFDRSDRKFVAVALAHHTHPPIANAVDSDWIKFESELLQHGVRLQQLCEPAQHSPRQKRKAPPR
jgi:hypothetical protein